MSDYILADDLSGALETGAVFRARGWKVTLPLDSAASLPTGVEEIQIVNTETRATSPARAEEIVRGLVESRMAAGSRLVFKKVDSTLRGPIGAELAAIIRTLRAPLVIVCPANPAAGRTVRRGELLVNGTPLEKTEFRNDPQWPALSSRVGEVVAATGGPRVAEVPIEVIRSAEAEAMFSSLTGGDCRAAVADAESDEDVRSIVRAARRAGPDVLLVGSGALAAALAAEIPARAGAIPVSRWKDCRAILIVCGSAHPASHRQIEFLAKEKKVPVFELLGSGGNTERLIHDIEIGLRSRGAAAIRFTMSGTGNSEVARSIQQRIGEFVASLFARVQVDGLVLTGGETAWTVCRRIGGEDLEVISEFEPGIVLSWLQRNRAKGVCVVTKPGGFGSNGSLGMLLSGQ